MEVNQPTAAAIVLALVQLIKTAGLPSRFAPILSIALGVGFAYLGGGAWQDIVMNGLVIGLTASGAWSGTKAVITG